MSCNTALYGHDVYCEGFFMFIIILISLKDIIENAEQVNIFNWFP